MRILQTLALPLGYVAEDGAGDGARTRHLSLGKAALYQMSYSRNGASEWSRTTDTGIFSPLLYQLSYRGKNLATRRGLEPLTFSVTG